MDARKKRLEDLNITRDEINNIGKALQKEEFRKLFAEYCEEVTNPENKKQFQCELTELEKERGVDVTFINPESGFVVKTSVDGERKAFINICKNDKVPKPSSSPTSEGKAQGRTWSLPFSLAPPREDYDKQRNNCTVFDVVFHPETHELAEKSQEFRKMLIGTALDAVETNCKVTLDKVNLKFPKMTYKGFPQAAVIRKKIPNHQGPEDDCEFLQKMPFPTEGNGWSNASKETMNVKRVEAEDFTAPKYSIKYRHGVDLSDFTNDPSAQINATVPKELVITIDLPLLKSAKDLLLDVTHKSLSLKCEKPKYKLDIVLPYGIDEDGGNASFDTCTHKLSLVLPVKRIAPSLIDVGREDSGVESDPGGRGDDDSDEKSRGDNSDAGSDVSDNPLVQNNSEDCMIESKVANSDTVTQCNDSLRQDVEYLLPQLTLNSIDNVVAVVVHVKNVESNSIEQKLIADNHGIQLSFSSLGGGMFPQFYGLHMIFPANVLIEDGSLTIEVWDNNVVVQFGLAATSEPITEMFIGTGAHDLQKRDIGSLAVVEKMLADLKENTDNSAPQPPHVEVLSAQEDELVLQIDPYSAESLKGAELSTDPSPSNSVCKTLLPCKSSSSESQGNCPNDRSRRNAVRQMSECSSDDVNGKKIRGILKKRPSRSLSESNADDYMLLYHSASLSDETESGSNSVMGSVTCIGEGGCETEYESGDRHNKKTVRFNDVVAQQTFRPNSSILGQRKKNQRKQRNKKRAQERRASESENSEPESEHERARRRACHSEGEASDFEDKSSKKNKFLKSLQSGQDDPQIKKILRRSNSSDTDEELPKTEKLKDATECINQDGDPGIDDYQSKSSKHLDSQEGSSEDERDKTDDKNKMKKKRKGKKMSKKGDCSKICSKLENPEFKSSLVLGLEM